MVTSRARPVGEETVRVRGIYDTVPPRHDRVIAVAGDESARLFLSNPSFLEQHP